MYGRNRGSANAKGRWLARGVETLLYQYPGLRVAFLDEAPGGRQYSVFIRGTGAPPEGLESQTVEIYRWALLSFWPPHAGRTNEKPPVLLLRSCSWDGS